MTATVDGRATRWRTHRATRRREIVESTLRAIRQHGPNVGMEEIAQQAKTSKTVIYRHFGDRTGLYLAVVESVCQYILDKLAPTLNSSAERAGHGDIAALIRELAEAYLELVERDPHIYRFIANRPQLPTDDDPMNGLSERIGERLTAAIAERLEVRGEPAGAAATWGQGAVGFVRAVTNAWLNSPQRRPRSEVADEVTRLFARAFPSTGNTPTDPTHTINSAANPHRGEQ